MPSKTMSPQSTLSLSPLNQNTNHNRWRTEAMRSHDSPRLIVVSKGHGRITIAGLTRGFGPNNLIYIPAGTMYGYETSNTVFGHILTIPTAMQDEWPEDIVHLRIRDVSVINEFSAKIDGLEKELALSNDAPNRAAHYHLGLISVFFGRQLEELQPHEAHAETSAARLVAAYTGLVGKHFRSGRGVNDYAIELGVTPTHLTRCCNKTCGKSAHDLLADRRHYEACRMLKDTNVALQDIAKQLGFSSAAYFSRAFQSRSGRSPSKFRKFVTAS